MQLRRVARAHDACARRSRTPSDAGVCEMLDVGSAAAFSDAVE